MWEKSVWWEWHLHLGFSIPSLSPFDTHLAYLGGPSPRSLPLADLKGDSKWAPAPFGKGLWTLPRRHEAHLADWCLLLDTWTNPSLFLCQTPDWSQDETVQSDSKESEILSRVPQAFLIISRRQLIKRHRVSRDQPKTVNTGLQALSWNTGPTLAQGNTGGLQGTCPGHITDRRGRFSLAMSPFYT